MFTQMGTSGNLPFCQNFLFFLLFSKLSFISISCATNFPQLNVPFMSLSLPLFQEVSWCSRLSHHFYVVRVPGSNPGGTIFMLYSCLFFCLPPNSFLSYISPTFFILSLLYLSFLPTLPVTHPSDSTSLNFLFYR